jgi:hypothetical protein
MFLNPDFKNLEDRKLSPKPSMVDLKTPPLLSSHQNLSISESY